MKGARPIEYPWSKFTNTFSATCFLNFSQWCPLESIMHFQLLKVSLSTFDSDRSLQVKIVIPLFCIEAKLIMWTKKVSSFLFHQQNCTKKDKNIVPAARGQKHLNNSNLESPPFRSIEAGYRRHTYRSKCLGSNKGFG